MQIGFILILIIAIFVTIFAIQNGDFVAIDLFFARYEMPLAVIMLICLVLGAVIVLILGTTRQFKKRSEHKELKNKNKTLEGEKAQFETNIKALETEKAEFEAKIEAFETGKENFQNEIAELVEKVAQLEDTIKIQEEKLNAKDQEIDMLKIQNISEIEEVQEITNEEDLEITDEQLDNENSEVESQRI